MVTTCQRCHRDLSGESAWASEWRVIDVTGTRVGFKLVTRFTCDDCAEAVA